MSFEHVHDGDPCPSCGEVELFFEPGSDQVECPNCGSIFFDADPDVVFDEEDEPTE